MIDIRSELEKVREEKNEIEKQIRERTVGYIIAALGLVAGLAWNDAMKSVIEYFFPIGHNTIFAKSIYALIVTCILVIISIRITRKQTP